MQGSASDLQDVQVEESGGEGERGRRGSRREVDSGGFGGVNLGHETMRLSMGVFFWKLGGARGRGREKREEEERREGDAKVVVLLWKVSRQEGSSPREESVESRVDSYKDPEKKSFRVEEQRKEEERAPSGRDGEIAPPSVPAFSSQHSSFFPSSPSTSNIEKKGNVP